MKIRKFDTSNYSVRSLNISKYTAVKKKNEHVVQRRQKRNMNIINTNNTYLTSAFWHEIEMAKSQAFDQLNSKIYSVPLNKKYSHQIFQDDEDIEIHSNPTIFWNNSNSEETNHPQLRRKISDFTTLKDKSVFDVGIKRRNLKEKKLAKDNKALRGEVNKLSDEIIGLKIILKRISEKYRVSQKYKPIWR